MTLTMAVGAGEHGHAASGVHAHFAAFKQTSASAQCTCHIAGGQATSFDVAGVTNAAQQTFGGTGRFACREARQVTQLVGMVHEGVEIAGVVLQSHWRLVRELCDEVLAANGVLRHAQLERCTGDDALEQVSGFWATSAAISINWRCVGEPSVYFHINLWCGVLSSQQSGVQNGGHRSGERRQIRAQVGVGVHAQCQELAVFVEGQFGVASVVTTVGIA